MLRYLLPEGRRLKMEHEGGGGEANVENVVHEAGQRGSTLTGLREGGCEASIAHGDAARKDTLCDALAEGERDKRRDSCFSSICRGSRGESEPSCWTRRRPQSSCGNLLLLAVSCSTVDAQWGVLWSATICLVFSTFKKNMLCLHHWTRCSWLHHC